MHGLLNQRQPLTCAAAVQVWLHHILSEYAETALMEESGGRAPHAALVFHPTNRPRAPRPDAGSMEICVLIAPGLWGLVHHALVQLMAPSHHLSTSLRDRYIIRLPIREERYAIVLRSDDDEAPFITVEYELPHATLARHLDWGRCRRIASAH